MKKYLSIAFLLFSVLLIGSCKKFDFNYPVTGEAVGAFKLTGPSDNSNVMLNSAAPTTPVVFSWSVAAEGIDAPVSYTFKIDKQSGDFSNPIAKFSSSNAGASTQLTLTHKSLDSLLGIAGVAANATANLKWIVVADNGKNGTQTATPFNISLTRFGIGLTSFSIFGPASSTNPITTSPTSTTDFLHFIWQKAKAVPSTNTVSYKVLFVQKQFDVNGNALAPNFSTPLFSIASNTNGTDTLGDYSYQQFSDSLNAHGLTDLSAVAQLQWTVVATAGTFSSQALYYNDLYIVREVKMYLVGAFQGWDPSSGIRMIPDTRSGLLNNMYYTYIYLPAGEFKFLQGTDWGAPGYGDGGSGNLSTSGGNLNVATAGIYRVSMNKATLKYDISSGRMGVVGAATAVGWNPPNVFPLTSMKFMNTNQFLGVQHFTADQWKMIDNNAWNDGSNSVSETRSYGSAGPSGSKLFVNGDNMPNIPTTGDYRIVWDASDVKNVMYMQMPITEMRVVGDGITGVNQWDPPTSPQMTYNGNGKWTITLSLIGSKNIKFLAGNAWGAFDYEDAGGGKIRYDGANNFNTPATTGTYTITLDENAGTVTIL